MTPPERVIINHDWVPHGCLSINYDNWLVRTPDGEEISLGPAELEVLTVLAPDESLPLDQILLRINARRAIDKVSLDRESQRPFSQQNFSYVCNILTSKLGFSPIIHGPTEYYYKANVGDSL